MSLKKKAAGVFRSALTLISPKLNTMVTYRVKFGRKLDLVHPVTLNEKILWLKFNTYWNNPVVKQCADKKAVRDYLEEKGFGYLLNGLIGTYYDVDEIDWDALPDKFAIKLNVGCGANIIVHDKSKLDIAGVKKKMRKWLKSNYWLGWSEMQYKGVSPCILIEEYLGGEDGKLPEDYKFYCMNGEARYVMVCKDRGCPGEKTKFFFMDRDWNKMPFSEEVFLYPETVIEKPEEIDRAFDIATQLSEDFPFARVDLYIVDHKIYFGELTFTPSAGMDTDLMFVAPGASEDIDAILGRELKLPI